MKKTMPKVLIVVGALSLIAAGVLTAYTYIDDYLADQRARDILDQVEYVGWKTMELTEPEDLFYPVRDADELENPDDEPYPEDTENSGEPIKFDILGILEIPKLKRKLPVLDRSQRSLLNISVCRFSGKVEKKPIRLIIAGHNYRSHFGLIHTLEIGDVVLFRMPDGETYRYSVIRLETCHVSEKEAVHAGDDWDITMITCQKPERTMRHVVRCKEIPEVLAPELTA